jgi:hypothetical protein
MQVRVTHVRRAVPDERVAIGREAFVLDRLRFEQKLMCRRSQFGQVAENAVVWHPRDDAVTVSVEDSRAGRRFEVAVDHHRASTAFTTLRLRGAGGQVLRAFCPRSSGSRPRGMALRRPQEYSHFQAPPFSRARADR